MKKILSYLIAFVMMVSMTPSMVLADDTAAHDITPKDYTDMFLDGSCSTLAYGVTLEYVTELKTHLDDFPDENLLPYINAAYNLLGAGHEEIHEPITLSQRGKRETEFNRTQTTYTIGGQYDITGYYARPGETIGIYANYDPKGPVPKIVFATANQDHREWYKGFDGVDLKIGYNEITCTNMKGCQLIYFYNPSLPDEQAFPPQVRLAGGTEYPVYRYDSANPDESESSESFYKRLEAYCNEVEDIDAEVEAGNGKYNVCELVSGRIVITTSAKGALKGLQRSKTFDRSQGASWEEGVEGRVYKGAKDTMELWEQMMREEYALYMGYNIEDPTHEDYEPRAAILWRAYTNGVGAGWAQSVFAGFNAYSLPDEDPWDNDTFASFTDPAVILEAYWLQYHEIGHVYDSRIIGTGESTNNLYALMASMKYVGKSRMDNENRWYNHFQTGINTGVFPDDDTLYYPAAAIFQLEAVDFSETALYPDIKSNYGRACRYARLHRSELESLSTKDDRLIVSMSMGAGVDLSDHFAAIGHEISDKAHWLLKDLPKETRHIEYANGRTFHGGAFSDELRNTAPVINGAVAGGSTGTVVINMNDTTYIENGTDSNLQCFAVYRQDITDESKPVPAEPEFVGITGDNLNTKGTNELYSFEDKDVVAGHKYKYIVTAYDCTFAPANVSTEVEVEIPDTAVVPIYWIDINHGIDSGTTAGYNDHIKLQLNYRPLNTTYDLRNVKWEYDSSLIELTDDPDYPGDPTRKVARAIHAAPSGSDIVVRIGGKNDLGYGYNDDGTLRTGPSLTATYNITVTDEHVPLTGVSISANSLEMLNGEVATLTAQMVPSNNTNANQLTWKSMDHNVAQVDMHGNVTAMGVGETDITASVTDSVSGDFFWAACHVTVSAADEPKSISIEPWEPVDEDGNPILYTGEANYKKMTLNTEPKGTSAHPDHVTWKIVDAWTDNPAYQDWLDFFQPASFDIGAAFYGSGVLVGLYDGTVDIQAEFETSAGTISSNVLKVRVMPEGVNPPTPKPTEIPAATEAPKVTPTPVPTMIPNALRNVSINHVDYTLEGAGAAVELELSPNPVDAADANKIIWKSSDSTIASVEKSAADPKKATVTAVSPGTITITGIWNGKMATCRVTVITDVPLTDLQFSGQEAGKTITRSMTAGDTYQLMLYPVPMNATGLGETEWRSDNEAVAMVDPVRGIVTAVSAGTAVITGTVKQTIGGITTEKSLTCTVTVKEKIIPLTGVSISEVTHSMKAGDILTLTLSPRPLNANSGLTDITWISDNEEVAVVGADGAVASVSAGTVTITGTMGGFSQSCRIVVESDVTEPDTTATFKVQAEYMKISDNEAAMRFLAAPEFSDEEATSRSYGFWFINMGDAFNTGHEVAGTAEISSGDTFYYTFENIKSDDETAITEVGFYAIPWIMFGNTVSSGKAFTYDGSKIAGMKAGWVDKDGTITYDAE